MEEAKITATLADANNDLLIGVTQSGLAHGVLLAANVGFIHFNRAAQHRLISGYHCLTDAMAQVPSRLVADSQSPPDLISGDSLTCLHQKQDA